MVIGVFVICYVLVVVCVLFMVKFGFSGVFDVFCLVVIVMLGMNSVLNLIVYMFRLNEFKCVFRNFFRGVLVEFSCVVVMCIGLICLDVIIYGV